MRVLGLNTQLDILYSSCEEYLHSSDLARLGGVCRSVAQRCPLHAISLAFEEFEELQVEVALLQHERESIQRERSLFNDWLDAAEREWQDRQAARPQAPASAAPGSPAAAFEWLERLAPGFPDRPLSHSGSPTERPASPPSSDSILYGDGYVFIPVLPIAQPDSPADRCSLCAPTDDYSDDWNPDDPCVWD